MHPSLAPGTPLRLVADHPRSPLSPLARRLARVLEDSVLGSRRNAMLASTTLAAARAERDDVEAFLRAHDARHPAPSAEPTTAAPSTAATAPTTPVVAAAVAPAVSAR
ncbi:hypothetical protein [Nocardioides sp. GY 10127]|uniref:hypothetical protein n=1 Tax=Nocardioides sp. GY 10127 TaxID=2569762 RepID=UPI0010A826EA|nr:hypothetical protein [Nocardioides sp. GY 10127]TIC80772.1 hypothetical protein E8D37_12950 [Nocardioides sp. GY 10127]